MNTGFQQLTNPFYYTICCKIVNWFFVKFFYFKYCGKKQQKKQITAQVITLPARCLEQHLFLALAPEQFFYFLRGHGAVQIKTLRFVTHAVC